MVDVATRATMASESEVHVARNFLTKILRSSMRRNRFKGKHGPGSRPQSWHSSKLTEEVHCGTETAAVWQLQHDARPKAATAPSADEPVQNPAPSSALTSPKPMERSSHALLPGHHSSVPNKYSSISDCSFNGKKWDATGGSSLVNSIPKSRDSLFRKGTSAENIFFKGIYQERSRFPCSGGVWEDQPMSRLSVGARPNHAPVWQIPDKKAPRSQSPPPPPIPLRSDSFAATKVFPFVDVPQNKTNARSMEHLLDNNLKNQQENSEIRRSLNPLPVNKDFLHPNSALEATYRHPSKLFSLSSIDVRSFGPQPVHQRQYSDESQLFLNTRPVPTSAKSQTVGSYYRSLQDLPTNIRKNQRSAAVTLHSSAVQNAGNCYRTVTEPEQSKSKTHWLKFEASPQKGFGNVKRVYGSAERNGQTQEVEESDLKKQFEAKRQQDPWLPQDDHRITPQKTPLLHSLAQENCALASAANPESSVANESLTGSGKISRRSDRYATTLRNEIQEKRAQLQKSRSAATLSCEFDEEEDDDDGIGDWKTSGISNTYKDHLKQAQARVLQATSFQRRDLELAISVKSNVRIRGRKRMPLAKRTHSFSEPDKMDKVGVEPDIISAGSFAERRKKLTEAKPTFAKPLVKPANASGETELHRSVEGQEKSGCDGSPPLAKPANASGETELHRSVEGQEESGCDGSPSEQRRLGTFAEYQATWSKQKKESGKAATGRFHHSAENILEAEADEGEAGCVHERSRSSPSADFHSTSSPWTDLHTEQQSSVRDEPPPQTPAFPPSVPRNESPFLDNLGHCSPSNPGAHETNINQDEEKEEGKKEKQETEEEEKKKSERKEEKEEEEEKSDPDPNQSWSRPPPDPALCPHSPASLSELSAEDVKRAELVRDIMDKDRSLAEVLDQTGRRTTMDLMEGLYPAEDGLRAGNTPRHRTPRAPASPRNTHCKPEESVCASSCLVPSSCYYNTSAAKAELLIKMKDMRQELDQDSEDELDPDLASKKVELIWSLARKLCVLREARGSLQEDVEQNEALGRQVEHTVQRVCRPNQLERFRMFVGDLDKVVSLLLSLSGRLARVENALNSLEEDAPNTEKLTLTEKRSLLMRQHEDARELKENLDRRQSAVAVVMETHLDAASLDDYRHFVKMKSALIIEQRRLEDKIKLGEEQLKCLMDSLPIEQRPRI